MPEEIVARILRLPGYGAYAREADEARNTLTLAVRQTAETPAYRCGTCGLACRDVHSWTERRIRDLPWGAWQVSLHVEVHRVRCPQCGVGTERLPFVAGKAHYTTRLEEAVAQACEAAPVSRVAQQWDVAPETVRRMDNRVLRRWAAARRRRPLRSLGVDEIYLGASAKFLTVVSDLETGEPIWAGVDRPRETLDRFFAEALPWRRRRRIRAVCVDMWEPYRLSLATPLPHARLVYDKFPILRHASEAVDETRRAEFFRQGGEARRLIRGKRWLLLRGWANLDEDERTTVTQLLRHNRPVGQGLPAQGATRPAVDLHLRGVCAPVPHQVARGPALATAAGLPQARGPVGPPPRRHPQLLPREGSLRQGRGHQRQHPGHAATRARLSGSRVPAAQGPESHRHPSPPSGRMNTCRPTDC
jgi:transposase